MPITLTTRRNFVSTASMALAATALPAQADPFLTSLAELEHSCSGRLGVAVLNPATGSLTGYRLHERFSMCSTFKLLLSAAVLHRCERGQAKLTSQLAIPWKPLLGHSPSTEPHAGTLMQLSDLCAAVVIQSDNTAANVLLSFLGGPAAVTAYARSLGDKVTRLDRNEPTLNESRPGDPRDTTSPAAMASSIRTLLLGDALQPASRQLLKQWMLDCQTGLTCLRAGLPAEWKVGDKTGSDGVMTRNDLAFVQPSDPQPFFVTAFLTECPGTDEKRNEILAHVGSLIASLHTGQAA